MNSRSTLSGALSISMLSVAVFLGACSQRTQDRAESAAERTGAAASSAAQDVANATENAANKVAEGTETAAKEVAGKIETMDVKKELLADSRVDASDINVDTDGTAKTITLNGSVPSAAQKALAAEIAGKEAPGYKIVNNLRVK